MNSHTTLDTLIVSNTLTVSSNQKSNQKPLSKLTTQAMASRHICPCCCSTLLRHTRLGEIYWRCSTCYQEMPV